MASTSLISEIALKLTIFNGRDLEHGHWFTQYSFCAKIVVDGKEFVTRSSTNGIWNQDFTITSKAGSHTRLEVICKHQNTKDDHTIGINEDLDVLGRISKPNVGAIEVGLSRPGRDKAVGFVRYTVEVVKTNQLQRRTDYQDSLSWRTLNSADIIRKVVFNDDKDHLVPPRWACIVSSLDGLVKNTQDLAELNSSAKVAIGAVCAAIKLVVEQVKRDKRVEDLTETMSTIYYHIQDTDFDKIKSFENTLQRLVKMTTECAYFIASYKKKVFARRTVESALLGVDDIIANFEENFSQLRIEFLMGSTLQSTHKVLLVLDKVRDIETLLHLQPLPLIQNTGWIRTRTELTPEQEKAFDGLTIWAQNPDEQLIAVLVGKSCEEASLIAHKLCERFHDQERLGSAIFFPATTGTTELSCKCLISTIARELAALHPTFAESIAETLAKSPSLALGSTDLGRQFEDLLIHPLQSLTVIGPILIVVDGLDRCPDHLKFVETLSAPHIIGKIPRNVRFLLAVGPESQPLYPLICSAGSSLRIWHAGGAFLSHLIMNVAWRYISKELQEPQLLDQLQDIEARMAPVYSRAELEIPPRPDPTITPTSAFLLSEIRRVVTKGKHAAFLNPLLNQARQCVPPELMPHFESYACFISTQASRWNHPFHILFLEFKDAVDPEISFWVQEIANTYHLKGIPPDIRKSLPKETSDYPKALPFLVLRYLNMTLKPNICRFEEITTLNEDIKNLDARLTEHVPAALGVLSGCWSEWVAPHLQALHDDHRKVALTELRTFLSSHLLSWIELISLLGCVDAGLKQLQLLESVLSQMVQETSTDTNDLKFLHSAVSDSIRFMLYFGTPIWDGGLFVHRLAFFAPTSTFIHRAYAPEDVVKTGLDTNWPYKFSVQGDVVRSKVGQRSNDPILTSLRGNSIKLWSLETGAHLRTFELPDSSIHSRLNKFLALPGKNHFAFLHGDYVSVFEPDRSVKYLRELPLKGHASSICYTADETSLAVRVQEGHLYFMDLGTSEIRTYPSFFPCQEHAYGILEISPNNRHIATCASSSSKTSRHNSSISMAVVEVYDTDGQVMITLEHSHSELFFLSQIIWSKDQFLIITIVRFWDANSLFYLWDGETSDYQKLDMGVGGSADFSDDGEVVILALKTEIRLINCSTFEVVISIPLNIPNPKWQMVLGHGLVMASLRGGLVFHDIAAKSKSESPHGFGSDIRPQAYRENVFQSSVKHKLRVQDLELVDGWLVMEPDTKLVWIPLPFRELVTAMDQITISAGISDASGDLKSDANKPQLVLDCEAVEEYFL